MKTNPLRVAEEERPSDSRGSRGGRGLRGVRGGGCECCCCRIPVFHLCLLVIIARNRFADALIHSGLGSDDEVRLVDHLFSKQGYNPLIRPVRNINESVRVEFNMALIQLINVDEKNQILKTNVWLRMVWHDYQLEWEPYEFGGISAIRVLSQEVWKPDIVLFNKIYIAPLHELLLRSAPDPTPAKQNSLQVAIKQCGAASGHLPKGDSADGKYEVSYKSNVVLQHTGAVLWIPPAIYKSSCTIHVEYFPFDEQECKMKFGSWTFNGDQVKLDWYDRQEKVDLSDYVNSGTWDVMSCPGVNNFTWDTSERHHKSQITYTLKIRRKTLFYTINLIIPCVLISFLSVCVFFLPADALEKMTMCISILLALVVFLLLVSKILPPTSLTIPLIAKYLLFTFLMNIVTILITVIIINYNFRTPRTHHMPCWVRSVFLNYLPRLVFMKRPYHDRRSAKKAYSVRHETSQPIQLHERARPSAAGYAPIGHRRPLSATASAPLSRGFSNAYNHQNCGGGGGGDQVCVDVEDHGAVNGGGGGAGGGAGGVFGIFPVTSETHKALEAVRFIAAHLKNEDDYAEILEDWRYIALVVDRLQLYIFLAVTICGTFSILINAPHIFEYVDQDKIIQAIIRSKDGEGLIFE